MNFTSLEEDLILIDDISMIPFSDEPKIQGNSISMIMDIGTIDIAIDLKRYIIKSPSLVIIIPGQVIEQFSISDDFRGYIIVRSKQYSELLAIDLQKAIPLFLAIKNNPHFPLKKDELEILKEQYFSLKKFVHQEESTYRYEITKHLSLAFFYYTIDILLRSQESNTDKKTKQESLFDSFYKYVQLYYKQERELGFYAYKLCLTPKYLSSVIKNTTGKSANEWIDSHVILEAQVLLKSSKMTILQISEELNFPSQSFFGKYFKRHVGMSPKEYKQI